MLLMAYGSPERHEDLEAYYTDIRRGRPPTPELLADLRARYDAIGGLSPLAERTRAQAAGLQEALDQREPGRYHVELGLKHAAPFIEDGVRALADCSRLVALVLAPHYSALSIGQYMERVEAAATVPVVCIERWHTEPELVELLAERVAEAGERLPADGRRLLLVTAHSLPVRALDIDVPTYPEQLEATAAQVADRLGLRDDEWRIAWQSAGRTPEPWIGPDILDVIRSLPSEGFDGVIICPAGFTSDHLEVMYDVDIEARGVAEKSGIRLERTDSLNDDPRLMTLLARLVVDADSR